MIDNDTIPEFKKLPTPQFRKLPSPQTFFQDPNRPEYRESVAKAIFAKAKKHNANFKLTGSEVHLKRAEKLNRQAARYRYCGYEYIVLKCESCEKEYIGRGRCESRICPDCSYKNGIRLSKKLLNLLKQFPPQMGKRLMLLTLTIKTNEFREPNQFDVKALMKNARKLINKLYPKNQGCGGIGVLEIGGDSNLHMHAIVYGYYRPQHLISDLWLRLTGDSDIVDIRALRNPENAAWYLLKYIIKPPILDDPQKIALYLDCITGIRRIHTYGVFYAIPLMKQDPCKCLFCQGKLRFLKTDSGLEISLNALFFSEAREIANNDSAN